MQTIQAVMLLLGCSHDMAACEATQISAPFYHTVEQCEGDIDAQTHMAESYPIMIAKCMPMKEQRADKPVQIQWSFGNNGTLFAYAGPVQTDNFSNGKTQLAMK